MPATTKTKPATTAKTATAKPSVRNTYKGRHNRPVTLTDDEIRARIARAYRKRERDAKPEPTTDQLKREVGANTDRVRQVRDAMKCEGALPTLKARNPARSDRRMAGIKDKTLRAIVRDEFRKRAEAGGMAPGHDHIEKIVRGRKLGVSTARVKAMIREVRAEMEKSGEAPRASKNQYTSRRPLHITSRGPERDALVPAAIRALELRAAAKGSVGTGGMAKEGDDAARAVSMDAIIEEMEREQAAQLAARRTPRSRFRRLIREAMRAERARMRGWGPALIERVRRVAERAEAGAGEGATNEAA